MKVGDDDEGRKYPSFLCLPKPPSAVAMSSNAPIPPGFDFGPSSSERSLTKTESSGLLGGFPLDKSVPYRNLINMIEGTVRSLLPLCKSISVLCVEVLCEGYVDMPLII